MLLKSADDKSKQIQQLEDLLIVAPTAKKTLIEKELRNVKAGIKGEQEAAYLINFDLEKSQNTVVIHDLRLDIGGRVAQIDHLLIHRTLNIYVLETKHLHAGLKITEEGEFLSWNAFKKCFEGMSSPFAQNERHISVLKEAMSKIDMPSKMGLRLSPAFHSYVLISPKSRIDRPKKFNTSRIIKVDMMVKTLDSFIGNGGFIDTFAGMARFMSQEDLAMSGQTLVGMHRTATFDYAARFGIDVIAERITPAYGAATSTSKLRENSNNPHTHICRQCRSTNLSIQYGKFGYYFKCSDCDANTPIKISCGKNGHKERIKKDGITFYRECVDCGTNSVFFVNPL